MVSLGKLMFLMSEVPLQGECVLVSIDISTGLLRSYENATPLGTTTGP